MRGVVAALAIAASLSVSQPGLAQSARSPGDISTIVMNAEHGGVAVGMVVELYEISSNKPRKVSEGSTGNDGRADLISGGPLPLGKYELRFQVADYFRKLNVPVGDRAFLDFVPVRFSITDPTGHYHVPLICSPWDYTTYRGS